MNKIESERYFSVVVDYCIDTTGGVSKAELVSERFDADPSFEADALCVVASWVFRPYLDEAGNPIAVCSRKAFSHGRVAGTIQPAD